MSNSKFIHPTEILATLRELNAHITQPLWLFGGVAVDFLVGRWTRPHGDIDLNTFAEFRADLTRELHQIGYHTTDSGWLTHWYQAGSDRFVEIAFLERDRNGIPTLYIRPGDPVGVPGVYPLLPDQFNLERFAELEGVRFRVSSPAGEWLARAGSMDVIGHRPRAPKLDYDQSLLETLIPADELNSLRAIAASNL
jgi:hypothetical protein